MESLQLNETWSWIRCWGSSQVSPQTWVLIYLNINSKSYTLGSCLNVMVSCHNMSIAIVFIHTWSKMIKCGSEWKCLMTKKCLLMWDDTNYLYWWWIISYLTAVTVRDKKGVYLNYFILKIPVLWNILCIIGHAVWHTVRTKHPVTKAGNESRENESRSKMFSPGSRIRLLDTRK